MKERPGRSQALLMRKVAFETRMNQRSRNSHRKKIKQKIKRSKSLQMLTKNYKRSGNGKKNLNKSKNRNK